MAYSKREKYERRLTFFLSDNQKNKLDELAFDDLTTNGEILRKLIDEEYERRFPEN